MKLCSWLVHSTTLLVTMFPRLPLSLSKTKIILKYLQTTTTKLGLYQIIKWLYRMWKRQIYIIASLNKYSNVFWKLKDVIYRSMSLIFVSTGNCSSNEYRCHNSRCIHQSLRCDDQNHCGDHSDTCPIEVVLVVGYVMISVISIVAVFFLIVILRYRCSSYLEDDYDYHLDDLREVSWFHYG